MTSPTRARRALLRNPRVIAFTSWLAAALLRGLGATWRLSIDGPDPVGTPAAPRDAIVLGAFWHRNALIAAWHYRDRGFSASVSRSRDGDLITSLLVRLGFVPPPRGSSSLGGAASLRGLVEMARQGTSVSIVTDGPSGPARRSKPGIVTLSRTTGLPIQPVGFSASPAIRFQSWDGTLLPLPFARIRCAYATPIPPSSGEEMLDEESECRALDAALGRLTDSLDDELGLVDPNR